MSLYGQYIAEREGYEIVESEHGFASFKVFGVECYIRDVYVKPSARNSGVASHFVDLISVIAKERNCKCLTTSVSPYANRSSDSMKTCLAIGFSLLRSNEQLIYLIKELN